MLTMQRALFLGILLLPLMQALGLGADNVHIIDDGDPEFAKVGNWSQAQLVIPNAAYNDDFVQTTPAATPGTATWTMFVNPGVRYRVSIVWYTSPVGAKAYSSAAPVRVFAGGTVLRSATLNMQQSPNDLNADGLVWENLGDFQINANPLRVELKGVPDKTVLADALRIERLDGLPIFSPVVAKVAPKTVLTSGNVQVQILGSDFDPSARFLVNGVPMTNTVFVSTTEMKATIPPQPAGLKDVTVISGTGLRHTMREALSYGDVLYMDDDDPGFSYVGNWGYTQSTLPNHAYNSDFRQGPPAAAHSFATWKFAVAPNEYLVSVVWPAFSSPYDKAFASAATYSIWDGENRLATISVNQQRPPVGFNDLGLVWQGLGNYRPASGRLTVRLDSDASTARKIVLADAVRVQPRIPVRFTAQPADQAAVEGGVATFSVAVEGGPPISYQWYKNGVRIPGATRATYVTETLSVADNGSRFQCVASNLFGPVPSRTATLTVSPATALQVSRWQR